MAKSPEYPDLTWVPPRSWTDANRKSVQLIVIHTTEGSSHSQSAEDGAAYDARRLDGTSAHYFVDSDSVVQCVRTADQAHTARANGNRRGIHYELCGRAGNTSAWWAGGYAQSMLKRAAKQAARDAKKWGIPVRHLTVDQVADGVKGFCGHWDITRAFPQDKGSHTDPGKNFPWTQFLDLVRAELAPDPARPAAEEQDVDLDDNIYGTGAPSKSWTNRFPGSAPTVRNALAFAAFYGSDAAKQAALQEARLKELAAEVSTLKEQLTEVLTILQRPAQPDAGAGS